MKENIFVSLPGLFVRLLEFPVTQGDLTACFFQVTRVLPFTYFAWSSCEFVRFFEAAFLLCVPGPQLWSLS